MIKSSITHPVQIPTALASVQLSLICILLEIIEDFKSSFPNSRTSILSETLSESSKLFPISIFTRANVVNNKKKVKIRPLYSFTIILIEHLFRHSRLTELALTKLNEPQLNRIAGWTPNSNMGRVYFHLDDDDIIEIMTDGEIQKPKPKKFRPIICPICNVENNHQNHFCWKCNNVLDESKSVEAGLYLINQTGKVDTLNTEFSEIKEKILNMEKTIKLQEQYIFHLITKDTEYKDLKLDENTNITNRLIQEYNKILGK